GVTVARHVGRSLDLLEALAAGGAALVVAYRSRQAMPIDLSASLRRIRALRRAFLNWPGRSVDEGIGVDHLGWPLELVEHSWSTLANEIAFVVNHIVDAQRIIERGFRSCGFRVPEGFGSTELQPLHARSLVPPSRAL